MFRQLTVATLLLSTLMLSSCGQDGTPGDAYLSLDWDWYVDGYNDNNPDLPNTISKDFDYSTGAGTFDCEYICSDGSGNVWYWEYEYTIKINPGENGKFLSKGDDGKDRYHKLFLNGLSNATFTVTEKNASKPVKKELKPYTLDTENFTKVYHGDPIIEVFSENGHTISIEKRMFTLE